MCGLYSLWKSTLQLTHVWSSPVIQQQGTTDIYGFTQLCNNMAQHTCVIFLRHIITWYGTTHVCVLSPLCMCDICPLYNTKVQQIRVIFLRCACVISVRYTIPRYSRYVWYFSVVRVWYLSVIQCQGTTHVCDLSPLCVCGICPSYNTKVQQIHVIFLRCACVISVRYTIPRYKRHVWSFSVVHVWYMSVIQYQGTKYMCDLSPLCVISVRHTKPRYKRHVWSSSIMQYHGRTHVWSLNVIQ